MIKALNSSNEARCPCLAHRISTALEIALGDVEKINIDFKNFCISVGDIRAYVQHRGGIQYKLPRTSNVQVVLVCDDRIILFIIIYMNLMKTC